MNGCSRRRATSKPWIAPRHAPTVRAAASATPAGQRHSTSIIDSSTPSRAQIDPTDRSMPPVMMTMPTPMLKMPYVPTRRLTFCRFATLRNWGLASATTAHRTVSSSATAMSFLVMVDAEPWRSGDRQLHDGLRRAVGMFQHTSHTSVVHDRHAIALGDDLVEVAAD